jgi:predicted DCC family thiol-disulfide oxidoreductase YuxK
MNDTITPTTPINPKDSPAHAVGRGVVLFDGDCPLCRKSVSILKKLDWLNRLHFQNARNFEDIPASDVKLEQERLLDEMHLLTPNRKKAHAGFKAFRWIAGRLPLLWMLWPLMFLPGVPWIGQKVYLKVAKNRFNLVPCKNGVCELPMKKK